MKIKPSLTNTQAKSIYEKFLGQNFKTIPIIAKLRLNALLLIATQRIETQEFGLNLYDIANILSYASNGEIPFYLAVIQQSLSQRDFGLLLEVFIEHEIANSQQSTFWDIFLPGKMFGALFSLETGATLGQLSKPLGSFFNTVIKEIENYIQVEKVLDQQFFDRLSNWLDTSMQVIVSHKIVPWSRLSANIALIYQKISQRLSPGENDDEVFSVLQYYYLATFVFPQLLLSIDEQLGNKKDHMLSVENNDAVLKVNFKQFLTEVFYSLVMVPFLQNHCKKEIYERIVLMHKEYYFPEVFIQLTNLERKTHSFMLEMTTHHKDLLINVYNAVFASKSSSSGNNNNNATRLNLDDDSHSIKGEVFNCNILVKQNTLRVVREMLSEVKKHPDKSLSNTVSGSSHTLINHIYSIYKNLALLSHINLQRDHKGFPVFGPVMQTLRINYENKLTTMVSHASLLFNQVLQADMANELQLPFIYALVKLISSLLELEAEPELKDKFAMTLQGQVSRCFLMLKTGAVEASKTEFLVSFCCYLMPKETMQQLNTWYNETTTLKNTEKRKYDQLKYKQDFVSKLVGHAKHELKVLARLDSIDYPTQLDTLIEKSVKAGVQNEVEALGFY